MLDNQTIKVHLERHYHCFDQKAKEYTDDPYRAFQSLACAYDIAISCWYFLEYLFDRSAVIDWDQHILVCIYRLYQLCEGKPATLISLFASYETEIHHLLSMLEIPHDLGMWAMQQRDIIVAQHSQEYPRFNHYHVSLGLKSVKFIYQLLAHHHQNLIVQTIAELNTLIP